MIESMPSPRGLTAESLPATSPARSRPSRQIDLAASGEHLLPIVVNDQLLVLSFRVRIRIGDGNACNPPPVDDVRRIRILSVRRLNH